MRPAARAPAAGGATGRLATLVLLLAAACAPAAGDEDPGPLAGANPSPPTYTALAPHSPTATAEPSAWAVTEPGCCSRPWWSEDGDQVLFVDDPPGDQPLGVYAVPSEGGPADLVRMVGSAEELAAIHPDGDGGSAARMELAVPAGAGSVRVSPSGDRAAWTQGGEAVANLDVRQRAVWVSRRGQGSGQRVVIVHGGGLIGWADEGDSLILTGRLESAGPAGVWRFPLEAGEPVLLAEGRRPRSAEISPAGAWVAFSVAFDDDPSKNGVWIAGTSGESRRILSGLASYRWTDDEKLLYIPFDPTDNHLALMALDPLGGEPSVLWSPAFPGGIAGNEWRPSPTGDHIVYRSAADGRLWVARLSR